MWVVDYVKIYIKIMRILEKNFFVFNDIEKIFLLRLVIGMFN